MPPAITAQPVNQTVPPGSTVTFRVTATGDPPLLYQWQRNGVNIAGATNATFTLTNVQTANAGDRKSTRLNSSHIQKSRMPSSA